MDNNKGIVAIAEKVKAFAIALVGICFFSIGTTYFQERLVYRLPRILIPVLDLFGNVALAIAMLILGAGLIYYGFVIWKRHSEKSGIYWAISIIALVIGVTLAIATDLRTAKKSTTEIMNEMDQNRQKQIDDIKNSGDLNFRNADVEKHIAEFDAIYKKYQQVIKDNDTEKAKGCWDEYMIWNEKKAELMEGLNNDQKYELSRYYAKLGIMWSEVE